MEISIILIVVGLVLIVLGVVPIAFGTRGRGYVKTTSLLERSLFYGGIMMCGIGLIAILTGTIILTRKQR